jgi:hypothetical protein
MSIESEDTMKLTPEELEKRRIRWEIYYYGWIGFQWRRLYKRLTGKNWGNADC